MAKLPRVLTVANVLNQNISRIPFEGEFLEAFGNPQDRGVWFIWGSSGSGKSSFLMQLAKAFAGHYPVLYNLMEEEPDDAEYVERLELFAMHEVADTFHTQQYDFEQLSEFIERKRSPKVYFIDSLRYLTRDFDEYMQLKRLATRRNKILICSGFAKGKDPRSEFEYRVMHDAKMKIFVSGYAAYCKGRTIGANGGIYIIYEQGFEKLQGAGAAEEIETELEIL